MTRKNSILSKLLLSDYQDFHRTLVTRFVHDVASLIPAGQLVLDAGAGEAMYRHLFPHAKYLAFDYAIGDPQWDYSHLDCICDLHVMPVRENSVPYVLCTQTFEHVPRPHVVMAELFRILQPGGVIFCSMPFIGDAHHQEPHDFYRYTKYAIEYLFRSVGFREITIRPMGGYNTLVISYIQKGLIRLVERRRKGPLLLLGTAYIAQKVGFLLCRLANRIAWWLDQQDPSRYQYALGFTIIARK